MVFPIGLGRLLTRQGRQAAFQEITKTHAQGIDKSPIALHKIHWCIERVIDIVFKAEARLKHHG